MFADPVRPDPRTSLFLGQRNVLPDPGIVLMNVIHDPAPDHFQDALLSDRLTGHQIQVEAGVLLKDFLVRRHVLGKLFGWHVAGFEKGFLADEMGVNLAPQLTQNFRKRFGNRVRLWFADQAIKLREQGTMLGINFRQTQQQVTIHGLFAS